VLSGVLALPSSLPSQEPAPRPAAAQAGPHDPGRPLEKQLGPADIIMPHITDSKTIEYPCYRGLGEWACEYTFPTWNVTIGGHTFDMGITKHIFFMLLAGLIVAVVLISTARSHVRHSKDVGRPKGFAAGLEAVILYLRDEIYRPVLGPHGGERYVPFVLTLFFFILYWPHDMPFIMKFLMTPIMTPVEIVGKFTKPFALTIRLFANMVAGHVIILALIGLIFMFGLKIAIAPLAMALFIMFLEILVAFIQAFIFSLLAAVFIGQIRMTHH
jgi:F-type H+-transporting ATPase subunit a